MPLGRYLRTGSRLKTGLLLVGAFVGLNYCQHHDTVYEGGQVASVSRVENLLGYIAFTRDDFLGDVAERSNFPFGAFSVDFFTDGGTFGEKNDQVDIIHYARPFGMTRILNRNQHLEEHRPEFEEADQEFAMIKKELADKF